MIKRERALLVPFLFFSSVIYVMINELSRNGTKKEEKKMEKKEIKTTDRIYYTINEKAAKLANDMMSFRDYEEGSKTSEYRGYVDKAYDLADKIVASRPNQAERVYSMAARYSKRMAEYMNRDISIGCMCPSVMISGAGNFPVKKKEKQNQAWDRNYQFYQDTQKILDKMKSILNGKDIIKSGDEDAIERLEEKLETLKESQDMMKAVNKAVRMKDLEKGNEQLRNMGYSDVQITEFRKPDFCGRIGFPDYALQNNNANIHRIEDRLKSLKAVKEQGSQESENQFFKVVENTEIMRLQLFFDGKPQSEVREILKRNGFKWAPSQSAWQRQLTSNAKYALNMVIKQLKEVEAAV